MVNGANAPVSPKLSREIYEMYQSGVSIYEISRQTGYVESTVRRHAKRDFTRKHKTRPDLQPPELTAKWIGDCKISGQPMYLVTGKEHEHLVPKAILDLSDWAVDG